MSLLPVLGENNEQQSPLSINKLSEIVIGKFNPHDEPGSERYEGEFAENKRCGQGTYTFASGERYEGEFIDGIYHGHGVWQSASGERYEGEFAENKRCG